MVERPTHYLLPSALRAQLLLYLSQRPYAEVAEGIRELNELQPVAVAPPDEQETASG